MGQQHEGIDEAWITRTVQGLRRDGEAVCVRVTAKPDGLDLAVSAGVCSADPGGRAPNPRERSVFDLWNQCGLSGDRDFPPGQLIQCLKRLERTID
jgi:hypothetical protein